VVSIQGPPAVMAYCHCDSCRSWLGAPLHAASLWPTDGVVVQQGNEHLAVYKRTEESHRLVLSAVHQYSFDTPSWV